MELLQNLTYSFSGAAFSVFFVVVVFSNESQVNKGFMSFHLWILKYFYTLQQSIGSVCAIVWEGKWKDISTKHTQEFLLLLKCNIWIIFKNV